MPDSNNDAERDMLNVAMHWYAFQMFTMRLVWTSGVFTWKMPRSRSQCARRRSNAASASLALRYFAMTGLTSSLLMVCEPGGSNFRSVGILLVAEDEDDLPRFSGGQIELDLMRADGRPAMSDGVGQLPGGNGSGLVPAAVGAKKRIACRVETGSWLRAGKEGEVIAALAVLGLVIDDAVDHFHFADIEVALEVCGVVLGVPQAEFDAGEDGDLRSASLAGWSP